MKNLILFLLILLSINAKSQLLKAKIDSNSIDVNIKLSQDTINYFGDVKVTIKITNKLKESQRILFGKSIPYQIGPWGTSVIIHTANNEIKKPNSPNFYVSQLYGLELEKYYTTLNSNESISKTFVMNSISTLKLLAEGHYFVQINYCGVFSNKVKLVLKDNFN